MPKKTTSPPPKLTIVEAPPAFVEAAEPPPVAAEDDAAAALAKRINDYVHHRLNQHYEPAVKFYEQELLDVFYGKRG